MQRRELLKFGLLGLAASHLPAWAAPEIPLNADIFVFIFLRGAMDGLSVLAPVGDPNYALLRPGIQIGGDALKKYVIDDHFALHPAFTNLWQQWNQNHLVMAMNCGSPDASRSHFDAQDYIELGTPGQRSTRQGLLNRVLAQIPVSQRQTLWAALALQASMPRSLEGPLPSLAVNELKDLKMPTSRFDNAASLESMYAQASDYVFRGVGEEVFKKLSDSQSKLAEVKQIEFPKTNLGRHLRDISAAIRAGLGVRIAVTEAEGWDTHVGQGTLDGRFNKNISELDDALGTFIKDLGPKFEKVTIVMMTEFGRTVKENGNRGTDHGHGSVAFVLGGDVRGGRLLGDWKPLKPENLFEGRDLPVTLDYRDVLAPVFAKRFAVNDLKNVFPNYVVKTEVGLF